MRTPWNGAAALMLMLALSGCGSSGAAGSSIEDGGLDDVASEEGGEGTGMDVVGSETGMVPLDESDVMEKGRLGPGEMIGVQLEEGRFYHDHELKDMLAARHPYSDWVKNIVEMDSLIGAEK